MTRIVVGVGSEHRGWEAIRYGVRLARQLDAEVLLAHVHPRPWGVHNQGDVDAEWLAYLQQESSALLEEAAAVAGAEVPYTLHSHTDVGTGRGLAHVAAEHGAEMIVIGSGSGADRGGLYLGGTAQHLLHAAGVPVVVVPAGWQVSAPAAVARVSVGWHGGAGTTAATEAACALAVRADADVRLIAFLIGPPGGYEGAEGSAARLREQVGEALGVAARDIRERFGLTAQTLAEAGGSWPEAVAATPWEDGDLLVIGSSGAGVLRRTFLGDAAGKILRSVGVPTMTVPRTVPGAD